MAKWMRYRNGTETGFGTLDGDVITEYTGDMFDAPTETGATLALADVEVLAPSEPSKMVGLWNNFHAAATKNEWSIPEHPLYFIKPSTCFLEPGGAIVIPKDYAGRVIYEGEIGVVIGKRCTQVSIDDAAEYVFGYTCVNDVTALTILHEDESFPQWTRSKSFDTFGPFGPVIETDVDPADLTIQTILKGRTRQDYPVSDMIFSPLELVSRISHDMTLLPGDVITCGTSLGALPMKPGAKVDVQIEGIGTLSNVVEAAPTI